MRLLRNSSRFPLLIVLATLIVSASFPSIAVPRGIVGAADTVTPSPFLEESIPAARLIEAARLTGDITYPDALRYRAFALTGDTRLPAEFAAAPIGEDPTLWREIRTLAPRLPAAERAELEEYLLRPNDPRSPFYGPELTNVTDPTSIPTGAGITNGPACLGDWAPRRSTVNPGSFNVWARCDDAFAADVDKALGLLDGLWRPMTELMGRPLADRGTTAAGGDPAIDVYLLSGNQTIGRGGNDWPAPFDGYGSLAYAIEDGPFDGNRASGFIVMDRSVLNRPDLRGTLAHEFFHILQYAHNYAIAARETDERDAEGYAIWELNWFFEASANWAHTHFVPETAVEAIHAVSFAQCFQVQSLSLHHSRSATSTDPGESCHPYGAYIWSYFAEQELGSPAFMKAIWDDIAEAEDWDALMIAIDTQLPFATRFRDFALRNLNRALLPGDPISPSYQDRDPDFPETGPVIQNPGGAGLLNAQEQSDAPRQYGSPISALSAHYYRFTVADGVGQIVIDLGDLAPRAALDVDLIVKTAGDGWQHHRVDPADPLISCRDYLSGAVEEVYVILSNHEINQGVEVAGEFTISSPVRGCD